MIRLQKSNTHPIDIVRCHAHVVRCSGSGDALVDDHLPNEKIGTVATAYYYVHESSLPNSSQHVSSFRLFKRQVSSLCPVQLRYLLGKLALKR